MTVSWGALVPEDHLPCFVRWDHDIHEDMERSTAELGNALVKQGELTLG